MKTATKTISKENETNPNSRERKRIRQEKENIEIFRELRKPREVLVFCNVFESRGMYLPVKKRDLIKGLQSPLKHGEKPATYRVEEDKLFLG